jgi:methylase of polypeptide subunit release factors
MTLNNKLSLVPLKKEPHHVLDLGTGTGVWATDFALEYPTAVVIGIDLSPIQPELYVLYDFRVPAN